MTTPTPYAAKTAATYTEAEVADLLEIPRSTLNFQRRAGYLNPALEIRVTSPAARAAVRYDAAFVDQIVAGQAELYVTAPVRGRVPGQDETPAND